MEREYRRTPDWPEIQTPLTGDELAEIWQDGEQRQGPLSVLGGVPSAHAASHKFGGTDVVGTQDKTANAIPMTDGSGTLDVFVSDASTTVKGKVQLATNGESAASKAVQSNDARLSNARTPTAHSASHKLGGSDVVGTQDKTANAIPITDGAGTLDVFVSDASTTKKGKVQLAANGERVAGKALQSNDVSTTNARTPTAHAGSHIGGSDDLGLKGAAFKEVGTPGGVCPLNASSQVDSGYLPSYVDDVIEVANFAALPVTGESGKIYVTLDTNLTYRWSGSAYVEISKSLALGETSSTAYRGDRGKTAYDHSQIITGNPHGTAISDISTLTGKITPLSDLSRVFRLTGDGTPIFPDNVAGRTYWQDDWATTDGWSVVNGTLSVSGGILKATSTTTNGNVQIRGRSSTNASKLFIVKVRTNKTLQVKLEYVTSIPSYPGTTTTVQAGIWTLISVYMESNAVANSQSIILLGATSTSDTLEVDTSYIGSGLFDTPVYDKACCNRFTNNGVLSVPGQRGLAMSFNGNAYLQADNPVIGTTGTLFGKFSTSNITQTARLLDNSNDSGYTGVRVVQSSASLVFVINSASASQAITLIPTMVANTVYSYKIAISATNVVWSINGGAETTTPLTLTPVISTTNMRIGANSNITPSLFFNGVIYDIGDDNRLWSVDDGLRYYVGDDAVDSQQKAQSPVPYSIATRKSDGRIEVATAVDNLDAVNKAQLDAACSEFLYQSYTAGSTFTAGQLGYLHTDGKVYLFDANVESSAKGALYIAIGAITANNVGTFQRGGEFITTGLSVGAIYYGSETPGAITTTAPTTSGAIVRKIGFAQSSAVLFFNPSNDYVVLV